MMIWVLESKRSAPMKAREAYHSESGIANVVHNLECERTLKTVPMLFQISCVRYTLNDRHARILIVRAVVRSIAMGL